MNAEQVRVEEVRWEGAEGGEGADGRELGAPPAPLLLVDSLERNLDVVEPHHRRRHAIHSRQPPISHFTTELSLSLDPAEVTRPRSVSSSAAISSTSTSSAARTAARLILEREMHMEEKEEEEKEEQSNPLTESVRHKLLEHGHLSLLDVVEKMPSTLHESIVTEAVAQSCLEGLSHRVQELQSGHLARNSGDSTGGAIHWYEGKGLIGTGGRGIW